jgi:tetratricopeptide (TPR) repeat protein
VAQAREIVQGAVARNGTDERWKEYLEGRLLLAQDQPAPALAIFEELQQDPAGLTESLYFGATLGSTEARVILNGLEAADDVLERFISRHEDSVYLEEAFRRLDELYEQEEHPSDGELKKWMQKTASRRAPLSQYYAARMYGRAHKVEKALITLENWKQNYPTDPLLTSVDILQADLQLERGNLSAAGRALDEAMRGAKSEEQRAQIELRTALVDYRQKAPKSCGSMPTSMRVWRR